MKGFNEWLEQRSEMHGLLNENFATMPQYHNIEILGWSLSKGTLPPWSAAGDDALDPVEEVSLDC